eukprot:363999-Chlamydomonas_euryale.AAC.3
MNRGQFAHESKQRNEPGARPERHGVADRCLTAVELHTPSEHSATCKDRQRPLAALLSRID